MKLVVFDLDSTLVDGESLDEFGKLLNKENEISKITKKAMVGEISFEEALISRAKLLEGLELEKVRQAAHKIPLMRGAAETVAELRKHGIKVAVVSGGFDVVANRVKDELGLDYAVANEFVVKDGKLTGEVTGPMMEEGAKGKIFEELAKKAGVPQDECVAVGDGANDISMLEIAGLAIAFNSKPILNAKADVIIKKKDLREILPHVFKQEVGKLQDAQEEAHAKLAEIKREIAAKKRSLAELSIRRVDLINSIKIENSNANKAKAQRDALNEKVKNHKKERDALNEKIRELTSEYKRLHEGVPKKDFKKLQALRDSLEWKLQTSVLEIKKEDELVSKIEKLNSELNSYKDLISLSSKIDELRKTSTKVHDVIIQASEASQVHHEKFLESVKNIKQLESQIDSSNSERTTLSQEIEKLNEEFNTLVKRAKEIERNLKVVDASSSYRSDRALREEAKEKYEKFKKGEKLGLGDIYLLRRFDLV